jgi:hypothetical protein
MKLKLLFGLFIVPCWYTSAQTVSVPDPIFEQLLIDKEIDTDGIINGQMATADGSAITSLIITYEDYNNQFINDLTGIEAFTNLESLTVNFTEIEELNVSTLINLKYLDCQDNMLSSLDVSNNALLEYLDISTGGDVYPLNNITEIDLSHNQNINKLDASGWSTTYINLKNGNNNPNMHIDISAFSDGMGPPPDGHTCIEVDDAVAAQNNQSPYSEWTINDWQKTYSLVADCSLGIKDFNKNFVSVYPNPVSDVLNFKTIDGTATQKAIVLDISGRAIKEYNDISDYISVSDIQAGTYILKLVSGKETFTQKIIKK